MPSAYTIQIAARICELMSEGKSLTEVCALPGMPTRQTIIKWRVAHDEFAKMYREAREAQAEYYVDQILREADRRSQDRVSAIDKRTKIDTLKWIACKFYPRVYGDRVAQEISGPDGGPIRLTAVDAPPQETREQWLERKAKERLNGTNDSAAMVAAVRTANGAA